MAAINQENLKEQILNWFWVVLLISTVFYLRNLIGQIQNETTKLSDERIKTEIEMKETRKETERFQAELKTQIDRTLYELFRIMNTK